MRQRKDPAERFWAKVDKSGDCWVWTAAKHDFGYGVFQLGRGPSEGLRRAHVLSWLWSNGPIPDGLVVCHRCDNPPCVRPDHLFLGTLGDNTRDMVAKGRDHYSQVQQCPAGHDYTEENTYRDTTGRRRCRECRRTRRRARRDQVGYWQ